MAWQDQQDQEKLRKSSGLDGFFGGMKGFFEDTGRNIGHFFEDADRNAADARKKQLAMRSGNPLPKAAPPPRPEVHSQPMPQYGNKMQSDYGLSPSDPNTSGMGGGQDQGLAALLKQMLTGGSMYDPAADSPYMSGLNEARSSSLKAIAEAQDRANGNFNESNNAIQGIYAKGHKDTLDDNNVLQASNDNLVGGLGAMYDGSVHKLQDERKQVQDQRMEMAQRMGLSLGVSDDATAVQDDAIQDTIAAGTQAKDKALQYGGADIASNTARASGLIAEGSGRQAELRSQLSGILGQLDSKRLDIDNQYANASMQAKNQTYQDNLSRMQALYGMYDKEQSREAASQNSILKSPLIAKMLTGGGSNSMTGMQGANELITQQGENAGDYNSAYTDAIMNAQAMPGSDPTDQQLLEQMVKRGMKPNLALSYIQAAKQNKSTVSAGGGGGIELLPYIMSGLK